MNAVSPYRVLVVDDDAGDVALVSQAIGEGPFPCIVERARDGIEALERLRPPTDNDDSDMPHLVLLDINMPRKNGHDVLNELKADTHLRDIPVVMLTTSDAERDIAIAYRAGASGYVTKPVDVDALFAAIQGIQEYWFGVMRLPGHRA